MHERFNEESDARDDRTRSPRFVLFAAQYDLRLSIFLPSLTIDRTRE